MGEKYLTIDIYPTFNKDAGGRITLDSEVLRIESLTMEDSLSFEGFEETNSASIDSHFK